MLWLALHAIFGTLLMSAAGFGCGAWIPSRLPQNFTRAERFGLSLLAGLGIFSMTLFVIGQFLFTRPIIFSAAILAALLAIRPVWTFCHKSELSKLPPDRRNFLPILVVTAILLLTAIAGTAEITGDWNNDAVAYHLLGPRVWLRDGIIRPVPDNSLTAFPAIPETLFAVLYVVGGDRAPDFSSFLTLGLLLLVSAGLGTRLGLSPQQSWWVAAIVVTMPAVYAGSHGCFVDGLYAAFILAAARVGFDVHNTRGWAIFGLFCGFAMGTKYTGLLAVPALFVFGFLALRLQKCSVAVVARNVAVALAVATGMAAPFYLRNWLLLGCPVYPPPLIHLFACEPKYLSAETVGELRNYVIQRGAGLGRGWLAYLTLPFNLTFHTANFHGGGGIGLCPLGLAPLGIVALRKNNFARVLLVLAVLLVSLWYVTQQESRFLIHVYVIAAAFSVAGWNYAVSSGTKLVRRLAIALVATSVAYGVVMIARSQAEKLHAVVSQAFATGRTAREIPYLPSFEFLNNNPSVQEVLVLDRSVPPFYLRKPYVKPVGTWGERTLPGISTSLEALTQTRQLGITHVLDVISPVSGFQIDEQRAGLSLVFQSADQRIYQVR
jgi:hypothetical protein